MNRGDSIRQMLQTDEGLADFLIKHGIDEEIDFCQNKPECSDLLDNSKDTIPGEWCKQCLIEWIEEFPELPKELLGYCCTENQGTLIRVPVAKGNIIWEIIDDGVDKAYIQGIEVQEVSDSRIWANDACFDYDDIGKTIFLFPKDAEARLKELEDTSHDQ